MPQRRTWPILQKELKTMPINNIGVNLLLLYMRRFPLEAGKWRFSQWLNERTHKIETVARTSYGFLMHLNTRDFIQHTIFVTGRWDDDVGRVILSRLKTDDVFVDIGANVGYFSLLASQICSKVISFEPNPTCLAQLNRNIEINKRQNIDVRPVGLADKRGIAEFHVANASNIGGGSLREGSGEKFSVQLDTLDSQLSAQPIRLIKIDIEGAEVLALKGASAILSRPDAPDVICEISENTLQQLGSSKEELFRLMSSHGYKNKIISPIRKSNLTDEVPFFQYDALFYKDGAGQN